MTGSRTGCQFPRSGPGGAAVPALRDLPRQYVVRRSATSGSGSIHLWHLGGPARAGPGGTHHVPVRHKGLSPGARVTCGGRQADMATRGAPCGYASAYVYFSRGVSLAGTEWVMREPDPAGPVCFARQLRRRCRVGIADAEGGPRAAASLAGPPSCRGLRIGQRSKALCPGCRRDPGRTALPSSGAARHDRKAGRIAVAACQARGRTTFSD